MKRDNLLKMLNTIEQKKTVHDALEHNGKPDECNKM